MNNKFLLLPIFLIVNFFSFSQDPTFSQTYGANVNLNTALAGNDTKGRLSTTYRNQWSGLDGFYKTSIFNFYQYIPKTNGFGGVNFMFDNEGDVFLTRKLSLFYSQNIKIHELLFRPSLEVAYSNNYINWNKLTFGNNIDPRVGLIPENYSGISPKNNTVSINIGGILYYKKILFGLSAHHINQPLYGFFTKTHYPINYGAQFSYMLELKKFSISPFAYYNYQNGFQLFVPGISFIYNNHFNFAFSARVKDALIFNLGYQNKSLAINYSYDYTISQLSNTATRGSHELSLSLKFWNVKAHEKFVEVKSVF